MDFAPMLALLVVNRHAVWLPPGSPSRDSQDDWDEAQSINRRP